MSNFRIEYIEESSLIEAFSHFDYFDPEARSNFYSCSKREHFSNEEIIEMFIADILDGNHYENLLPITDLKANMLLRQMAMTKVDHSGRKERVYSSAEAKESANLLMGFMGKSTEYYSNISFFENPHDNPGKVISYSDQLYGEHDSICFFAINTSYLVFIEQAWNFKGE